MKKTVTAAFLATALLPGAALAESYVASARNAQTLNKLDDIPGCSIVRVAELMPLAELDCTEAGAASLSGVKGVMSAPNAVLDYAAGIESVETGPDAASPLAGRRPCSRRSPTARRCRSPRGRSRSRSARTSRAWS